MNKQSIQKLDMFLTGLETRIQENFEFLIKIHVNFKSGTKDYKANIVPKNNKLEMNFNGNTEVIEINWLSARLSKFSESYESVSVTYEERGNAVFIEADNKNVKMSTRQNEKEIGNLSTSHTENSQIRNRNYFIKVGHADKLLKEIGILSGEGKIKNDMIRKYNQIDHFVELINDMLIDITNQHDSITVIDCACGKSYLAFVLNYYIKEVLKKPCHFIGLDYSNTVIEASKRMAQNLGYGNMEFMLTDIKNYKSDRNINLVISLHACDTATDEAMALAVNNNVDSMVLVPCCHREMLNQYQFEPFKHIIKHGILKARLADTITDGMRSLFLESLGYKTSVVEYISPLETPKNLMIRARKSGQFNENLMNEYIKLKNILGISLSIEKMANVFKTQTDIDIDKL